MRSLPTLVLGAILALSCLLPAQGFTVTPYGPNCGPVASGTVERNGNTYRFYHTVNGVVPRSIVLLIVGVNEINLPINFGGPCQLLTELAFTQTHLADTTGSYTWSHALSAQFRGYARIQFAEVQFDAQSNLLVRASNGLFMTWN